MAIVTSPYIRPTIKEIDILIISSLDSPSVQYAASTAHSRRKEIWAARRQEESES